VSQHKLKEELNCILRRNEMIAIDLIARMNKHRQRLAETDRDGDTPVSQVSSRYRPVSQVSSKQTDTDLCPRCVPVESKTDLSPR